MTSGYELMIFDMDGVLVGVHSSWAWVHDHFGVDNDDSLQAYLNDEIDDKEFIRRDISLWKGVKEDVSREDIRDILEDVPRMPGFKKCMSRVKERGYRTAIISGGLKPLARTIGDGYFDRIMANDVEDEKGLTGEGILEVKLDGKGEAYDRLFSGMKGDCRRCIAVGNSFIDAPMLERAELGIAFNPADQEVREAGDIVIEEKDLSRILEHLG